MGKVYSMTIKYLDSKRISLLEADRSLVQGFAGGNTPNPSGSGSGAGGGGAGGLGSTPTGNVGGTGGAGLSSSITGSAVTRAGGGGGGGNTGAGSGGSGGGGNGATGSASGSPATVNGSGGGGGAHASGNGGSGSDGIVIIRFTTSGNGYSQAGGSVTTSGSDTIVSWTATSGTRTFTPTSTFDVEYLIIAGGGSGASFYWAGGGGAGGYLTDTGKEVTAQAYTIVVGAGGATESTANTNGNNGSNSSALGLTAIGGGAGATDNGTGSNGGSGGGSGGGGGGIRGEGTSTDLTPTNVQDNSILVEKDTANRYWSSGYFPSATVTRSDDFSSDGWTDNDSTNMGVSGGTFNWNAKRDGTNDASVYDLTSTSANWVLRFKLHVTNVSSSTQAGNGFFVGLSDGDQSVAHGTAQDFIGVSIYNDNTDTYRAIDADGTAIPDVYAGDSSQTTTYNTGSIWYYEIIKTGSSYTVEAFSNSDYSTGSEGQITGSSTASGLRYLKIINDDMSISTSTNPFQGTIDDLKFYDGVTNVGSPATWTMEPTFEDDFSGSDSWTDRGTSIAVSTSNDRIDWDVGNGSGSNNDGTWYDLGAGVVNTTKWVLTAKIHVANWTANSSSSCHMGVGLTDTKDVAHTTSQDSISFAIGVGTGDDRIYGHHSDSQGALDSQRDQFTITPSTTFSSATSVWLKLVRDGSNTMIASLYSDEAMTTLLESKTTTMAGTPANLRYVMVNGRQQNVNVMDGYVDDIKFYNGVSSL